MSRKSLVATKEITTLLKKGTKRPANQLTPARTASSTERKSSSSVIRKKAPPPLSDKIDNNNNHNEEVTTMISDSPSFSSRKNDSHKNDSDTLCHEECREQLLNVATSVNNNKDSRKRNDRYEICTMRLPIDMNIEYNIDYELELSADGKGYHLMSPTSLKHDDDTNHSQHQQQQENYFFQIGDPTESQSCQIIIQQQQEDDDDGEDDDKSTLHSIGITPSIHFNMIPQNAITYREKEIAPSILSSPNPKLTTEQKSSSYNLMIRKPYVNNVSKINMISSTDDTTTTKRHSNLRRWIPPGSNPIAVDGLFHPRQQQEQEDYISDVASPIKKDPYPSANQIRNQMNNHESDHLKKNVDNSYHNDEERNGHSSHAKPKRSSSSSGKIDSDDDVKTSRPDMATTTKNTKKMESTEENTHADEDDDAMTSSNERSDHDVIVSQEMGKHSVDNGNIHNVSESIKNNHHIYDDQNNDEMMKQKKMKKEHKKEKKKMEKKMKKEEK